jgi:tetratricopeptide (TPR) repeat protein
MTQGTPAPEESRKIAYPNYIRYYLKQQGYSIQELSQRTGISRRSLTDYLGGSRAVPRVNLKKIARVLRCSIHELVLEPDLVPRDQRLVLQQRRRPSAPAPLEALPGALDVFEIGVVAFALACQQQLWTAEELRARFAEAQRRILEMAQQHTEEEPLTRRQALTLLAGLPVALMGVSLPGKTMPLFGEELLPLCATSIPACWELYFDGGHAEVERILPTYLAKLPTLAKLSSPHQEQAANFASQAYQLACQIAGEQEDFGAAAAHSQQALLYAQQAGDSNLQVAALIRKAGVYFRRKYPFYSLQAHQTYQEALPLLKDASPLLGGRVYVGLAEIHAKLGQEQEALRYMGLARDIYPAHPEEDAAFPYTGHSHFSLYLYGEGLTYLNLGQIKEARNALERLETMIPETVTVRRVELLVRQAAVAVAANDLDQSFHYTRDAAESSKKLNTRLFYSQAFDIYQGMPTAWSHERPVKALADVFQPW